MSNDRTVRVMVVGLSMSMGVLMEVEEDIMKSFELTDYGGEMYANDDMSTKVIVHSVSERRKRAIEVEGKFIRGKGGRMKS
jgi:hypothetical protein